MAQKNWIFWARNLRKKRPPRFRRDRRPPYTPMVTMAVHFFKGGTCEKKIFAHKTTPRNPLLGQVRETTRIDFWAPTPRTKNSRSHFWVKITKTPKKSNFTATQPIKNWYGLWACGRCLRRTKGLWRISHDWIKISRFSPLKAKMGPKYSCNVAVLTNFTKNRWCRIFLRPDVNFDVTGRGRVKSVVLTDQTILDAWEKLFDNNNWKDYIHERAVREFLNEWEGRNVGPKLWKWKLLVFIFVRIFISIGLNNKWDGLGDRPSGMNTW